MGAILWGFESPLRHILINNMKKKGRVAILLSGRGSNFLAIYKNSLKNDSNFKVAVVISNKKNARGLQKARDFKLKAYHVSPKKFDTKEEYETEILNILKGNNVDLICLAGYMRIVGDTLLNAYKKRIINIHPALLPSFPGLDGQKQALDHGVKVSGCTVHFVDSGVDTGPIIIQKAVKIEENDSEESLSKRILKQEHRIYSEAIKMFFDNRLKFEGRKVKISEE